MPIIIAGDFDDLSHQFGVADGETVAVERDVVFQAGAAMPTKFETPLVDLKLVSCLQPLAAGCAPRCRWSRRGG
jgi:hypothetical protein